MGLGRNNRWRKWSGTYLAMVLAFEFPVLTEVPK